MIGTVSYHPLQVGSSIASTPAPLWFALTVCVAHSHMNAIRVIVMVTVVFLTYWTSNTQTCGCNSACFGALLDSMRGVNFSAEAILAIISTTYQ
eukprot:2146540-Amphidinium_carterae.1